MGSLVNQVAAEPVVQTRAWADPCTLLCTHFALFAEIRGRSPRTGYPGFWLGHAKYERRGMSANLNPQNS